MDTSSTVEARQHAAAVDFSLKELERQVAEQEAQLAKLRSSESEPLLSGFAQIKLLTKAFQDEFDSSPFLPASNSILPALLALRKTHETIEQSKQYLEHDKSTLDNERRRLEADQANLKDQTLLTEALEARLSSLRTELGEKANLAPEDAVRHRIEELKNKKQHYKNETAHLMKSLITFIDEHLAASLAAEELGGPVVGDLMDIDSNDLAAGFNAQGKLRKGKAPVDKDKRQRRLDEIWGHVSQRQEGQNDEVRAAGTEMRELTEDLLNQLVEAKGDVSASYVTLEKDSAAARFLVRSKVAQFHPKDATRLCLIDFGRDLDS